MITVKYLNFINEDVETKTVLDSLVNNINKVNKPKMDKKSKILKEISVVKTADDQTIEQDGIYFTLFDSATKQNGINAKQIKVSVPFNKSYITYVESTNNASITSNKIFGYLIVKDKNNINILKDVQLLSTHRKQLEGSTAKTEPKPAEPKPAEQSKINPPKKEVKQTNVEETTDKKNVKEPEQVSAKSGGQQATS